MTKSDLRTYLATVADGEIGPQQTTEVERLLMKCWHELTIVSDDERMEGYKLLNRTEGLGWHAPFLTFDIERHGATVNGSIYAEVHSWKVNVDTSEAFIEDRRRRQLHNKSRTLKVEQIAEELAAIILEGKEDARLVWAGATKVRVNISLVIPETNKQTTGARRKRFRVALEKILSTQGWKQTTVNTYTKQAASA